MKCTVIIGVKVLYKIAPQIVSKFSFNSDNVRSIIGKEFQRPGIRWKKKCLCMLLV